MTPELEDVACQAYEAFDAGNLKEAATHFGELLRRVPDDAQYHYMQGLAHKYLRNWQASLHHNLRSQALRPEPDEASIWNAGIAATALEDWAEVRRQWKSCGLRIPEGEGPIESDFGIASVRLNPWGDGETVFARRIDPVRARLLNVPLPESGYRFLDIVLHDGASTGSRKIDGQEVHVFNVMERLQLSDFKTYTAFVTCEKPSDLTPLLETRAPGIGYIEDWTGSMVHLCLRCSYGIPHRHQKERKKKAWEPARNIGIAAQSRQVVTKILDRWKGKKRRVHGIESRKFPLSSPPDGVVWWRFPGEEGQEDDQG
jgi:hypothetical protein